MLNWNPRIEIDISKILKLWNGMEDDLSWEEKKKKKKGISEKVDRVLNTIILPRCQVSISDDYRLGVRASPPLIGLTVLTVSLVGSP